jgi:ribonuclease P protein component
VSRFGWSVKKGLGSAVRRNRIRRRLREIVRLHRHEIASGWDIVIHPRSSAASEEFSALTQELLRLLPRRERPTN